MTGRGGGGRKVLLPPINFIFKLLQSHATVKIWLYEQLAIRIEGKIRVRNIQRVTGLSTYLARKKKKKRLLEYTY